MVLPSDWQIYCHRSDDCFRLSYFLIYSQWDWGTRARKERCESTEHREARDRVRVSYDVVLVSWVHYWCPGQNLKNSLSNPQDPSGQIAVYFRLYRSGPWKKTVVKESNNIYVQHTNLLTAWLLQFFMFFFLYFLQSSLSRSSSETSLILNWIHL